MTSIYFCGDSSGSFDPELAQRLAEEIADSLGIDNDNEETSSPSCYT